MALRPKKVCLAPGCKRLSYDSYCPDHVADQENARSRSRAITEPHRAIYKTREWRNARMLAKRRDGFSCQAIRNGKQCGSSTRLTVHHILPLKDGGAPYDLDNLITLCRPCHAAIEGTSAIKDQEVTTRCSTCGSNFFGDLSEGHKWFSSHSCHEEIEPGSTRN